MANGIELLIERLDSACLDIGAEPIAKSDARAMRTIVDGILLDISAIIEDREYVRAQRDAARKLANALAVEGMKLRTYLLNAGIVLPPELRSPPDEHCPHGALIGVRCATCEDG